MKNDIVVKLDDFDLSVRREALDTLCDGVGGEYPSAGSAMNCHAHTFYSYNAYGYSPLHFAWLAKQKGLSVAGIVDFDVLDGLDEFVAASQLLKLKGCVSLESRTFVPEFADRVINSPGEPGVAYHMGIGFTTTDLPQASSEFLAEMRNSSDERNRGLLERVNAFMKPVELDYEKDVQSLTPAGNATERHICLAYARKAAATFQDPKDLAQFWSDKLDVDSVELDLPVGGNLQALIRSKTMKRGGVGYVQPSSDSFPDMSAMNSFILESGAIPALTWLDGTSAGEQDLDELLELSMKTGVAAINIIPDRNFTVGVKDDKLANLYTIVELAEKLGLPVLVGTEMNSPGLKFVDDFECVELAPLLPVFEKGAYIVYAHSVLQSNAGMGYLSDWAASMFDNVVAKNEFFEEFGRRFSPGQEEVLVGVTDKTMSDEILTRLK